MDKFQVKVTAVPADRNGVVRALRVIGRMPLVKAVELYEYVSMAGEVVVVAGVDRSVADHVQKSLDAAGVSARIDTSAVPAPMVLDPGVDEIYQWGALRTLRRASRG